jgi:hypothetical protein
VGAADGAAAETGQQHPGRGLAAAAQPAAAERQHARGSTHRARQHAICGAAAACRSVIWPGAASSTATAAPPALQLEPSRRQQQWPQPCQPAANQSPVLYPGLRKQARTCTRGPPRPLGAARQAPCTPALPGLCTAAAQAPWHTGRRGPTRLGTRGRGRRRGPQQQQQQQRRTEQAGASGGRRRRRPRQQQRSSGRGPRPRGRCAAAHAPGPGGSTQLAARSPGARRRRPAGSAARRQQQHAAGQDSDAAAASDARAVGAAPPALPGAPRAARAALPHRARPDMPLAPGPSHAALAPHRPPLRARLRRTRTAARPAAAPRRCRDCCPAATPTSAAAAASARPATSTPGATASSCTSCSRRRCSRRTVSCSGGWRRYRRP